MLWRYNHGKPDVKQRVLQTLIDDQSAFGVDNRAAIEYVRSLPSDFVPPPPSPPPRLGHVYEVEIAHPESALLDLDLPVEAQPKAVQEALGGFARAPSHFTFGQEGWRGMNAYMRAAEGGASQAEASRFFQERGIPGLRYWDGDSRSKSQGTHNYVMFPGTEDQIRVLRKYGLLAPMAAAGTMGEE